ncbi:hypothetical protein OG906_33735 [Streptomyces sp. NBC_01426]|nr:hypothetical protein [Streptomyces sp. NBC_01426]
MIRTPIAQAVAVVVVSLTAVVLVPGAALAATSKTPSPVAIQISDSLGWG